MTYVVAHSLEQALDVLVSERATVLAGGTDLFAQNPQDLPGRTILDLSKIDALRGISIHDDGWRIGANVTWAELLKSRLSPAFDGLKSAGRDVGSLQIQNTATLVGNLCNASPAADGVPALLTLNAELELVSPNESRRVALDAFLLGPGQTCLKREELVSAIHIPTLNADVTSAFKKLGGRQYLVISIAMVAVVIGLNAAGEIETLRLAIGACGPVARRQTALETTLIGQNPRDVIIRPEDLQGLSPISDIRATAGYRCLAAAELATRVVRQGAER